MVRQSISVVCLTALIACGGAQQSVVTPKMGPDGPGGISISLEKAKRIAPYTVSVPSFVPGGNSIRRVLASDTTGGSLVQILLEFNDGTFIEFLPKTTPPTYSKLAALRTTGRIVTVRGAQGFAIERGDRMVNERLIHDPTTLRWYANDVEYIIRGEHDLSDLLRMAESV